MKAFSLNLEIRKFYNACSREDSEYVESSYTFLNLLAIRKIYNACSREDSEYVFFADSMIFRGD